MSILQTVLKAQNKDQKKADTLALRIMAEMKASDNARSTSPFVVGSPQGNLTIRLRIDGDELLLEMLVYVGASSAVFSSGQVISARAQFNPLPLRWDVVTDESLRALIFEMLLKTSIQPD